MELNGITFFFPGNSRQLLHDPEPVVQFAAEPIPQPATTDATPIAPQKTNLPQPVHFSEPEPDSMDSPRLVSEMTNESETIVHPKLVSEMETEESNSTGQDVGVKEESVILQGPEGVQEELKDHLQENPLKVDLGEKEEVLLQFQTKGPGRSFVAVEETNMKNDDL